MLYVFASDGLSKYNMLLGPSCGFDITCIDEKTIAITTGDSTRRIGIDIINTEQRQKIKSIDLPGCSYGIARNQDSLFACVEGRGILKVNTVDYTTSHVISCNLPILSYVSVFDNKIYYTDWRDNSVVCCDRKGSHDWTFKDVSVLNYPRGITVDNDGNVFVVGVKSANVVIISNDGKHHRKS
ncbi:NID [Mytilus edulis]|uniref:NID n=1 Tax=Mytilus edulis TaxID=6550 RepID=A0A8S3TEJ7_MYTED|nr:NID [Mytilus edulis]